MNDNLQSTVPTLSQLNRANILKKDSAATNTPLNKSSTDRTKGTVTTPEKESASKTLPSSKLTINTYGKVVVKAT